MPKEILTFDEFVATKRQVQISEMAEFGENPYDYDELPRKYFIYNDTWWIQEDHTGSFYTLLYINEFWYDDIMEIETILYEAYCREVTDP
jgi:hypothetical protein